VQGSGPRIFRAQDAGLRVVQRCGQPTQESPSSWLRVEGSEFRVQNPGSMGSGFGVVERCGTPPRGVPAPCFLMGEVPLYVTCGA
jgi:hypothetical protein